MRDLALSAALGACIKLATLGARPRAGGTRHGDTDGDLFFSAEAGFFERELEIVADVGALTRGVGRTGSSAASAKKVAEDIAEMAKDIADILESGPAAAAAIQPLMAKLIVERALFGVGEDVISLGRLLKLLLGLRIVRVAIGMVLEGELTKRFLQLAIVGPAADAEDLIIITLGHKRMRRDSKYVSP